MSSFWKHLILDLYKNIDPLLRLSVQKKLCWASFSDLSVLIRFDTFSGRINLSLIQSAEWMKIKTYFENNFKKSKINSINLLSRKEFFVCQWKSCRQNVNATIHCFKCFFFFFSLPDMQNFIQHVKINIIFPYTCEMQEFNFRRRLRKLNVSDNSQRWFETEVLGT